MNFERGLGIAAGLGLIAALFAPVHRMPVIEAAGMIPADGNLTLIGFYPVAGLTLGLIAALGVGLTFAGKTRALVGTGGAALVVLALLARSVLEAKEALETVERLRPDTRAALEFTAGTFEFQWGWIALAACAAAMVLAGALAWFD